MALQLPSGWFLIAGFIIVFVICYLVWDSLAQAFSCCCSCSCCRRRNNENAVEAQRDVEACSKMGTGTLERMESATKGTSGAFTSCPSSAQELEENPYTDFKFTGGIRPASPGGAW